jgi:RNA polymerase sigma-70 factor, ECF subfamily
LLSDDRIIRRALKGDHSAFRELVTQHEQAVFRLACRMLNRREDAEDAVQEAFLRAYQNLSACSGGDKFAAWLRRIVVNCCLTRLNSEREIPSDQVEEALDSDRPYTNQVEIEVLRRLAQEDIRGAIDSLPDSYRTVVVLRYHEDLTCVEIADLLSESPGAIRVRLHRAHKALAERLAVVSNEM